MQCNKNVKKLVVFILMFLPLLAMAEKRKVTYFSPSSFYVYSMASWINNVPSFWFGYDDDAVGPLLGFGYTVVNFSDRILLNLEFDVSTGKFGFDLNKRTRLWFYSFMLNGEYRFRPKTPLSIFLGIGGSVFHYGEVDDNEVVVTMNTGLKLRLMKHLMLRLELRHHWQGTGDSYYWDDSWGYWYDDEGDSEPFGTAVAMGVEIHF